MKQFSDEQLYKTANEKINESEDDKKNIEN